MPVTLEWRQVVLRLFFTVVAGLVIGFNRGEHGRPAGMRTTLLVCLAASIAMIQANLLMNSIGKTSDSFVVLDLMRLPLGILSGMGFIGAGAILRKDNLVLGVTTAATLWFTTVMGLCFGGGQIGLGTAALVLGLGILWGLKHVEKMMPQDVRASLTLVVARGGPTDEDLQAQIAGEGCVVIAWGVTSMEHGQRRQIRGEIQRRVLPTENKPPDFVGRLVQSSHIETVRWQPQGLGTDPAAEHTEPRGTPVAISEPR